MRFFPLSSLRQRLIATGAALLLPFAVSAQPAFEENFNGGTLGAGWTAYDGYAALNPGDTANYASFQMTGTQLSIAFPAGYEHNMWWNKQGQVTRPFIGSGTYEIKVDSTFTGAQQFGLIFQGADAGTFMVFMLYSYVSDQAKAYVERFSYVNGEQHKQTFQGGGIGKYIPAAGPYYIRVTVDDHPLPQSREWNFEWSTNGTVWTPLVSGILEGSIPQQNIGAIQHVGVFAGNQPQTYYPPYVFDGFDGRFDYFRFYEPDQAPLPAPANVITRAGDNQVDLWWDAVSNADVYAVYNATTPGGPYTRIDTTLEPSFTHVGAANGVRQYYVVSAFQSGIEGAMSPEVDTVPHAQTQLSQLPSNGLALVLSASELAYSLNNGEAVTHWPTALGGTAVAVGPDGSKPTFVTSGVNGQPAVRFDGVNDYLSLWGNFEDFTAGISMYVVAKPTTLQSGSKYLMFGNGASWQNIGFGRAGQTSGYQYFTDSGWGPVGWFNSSSGLVAGQSSLVSLIQDGGSQGSQAYAEIARNGVALAGGNVYVPPVYQRALNYIGRSYWSDGLFQGDIAEVIVYNRKLSAGEQAAVRAYVAVKYGLAIDGYPGTPQPVDSPTSLTAVGGDTSVSLAWAPVTGAGGYRVYRSGAGQTSTMIASPTGTSFTDTTVANGYTYQYTVTAFDQYLESPQSTAVTVTPTAPAQLPTSVPQNGLLFGLDAQTALQDYGANQAVGVWRDSSASYNHAMSGASAPVVIADALNGKPVVRFDGVDDYLSLPSGFADFTGGITFYVVMKPASLPTGFKMLLLGNNASQDLIGFGHAGSTSGLQYFTSASSGSVTWFNTGSALDAGTSSVFSLVQQPGPANGISYAETAKNGQPLYGQAVFVPPVVARAQNYIGNSYWADGKLQGDVAEILLYNRTLGVVEQSAVRAYLGQKYGITVQ